MENFFVLLVVLYGPLLAVTWNEYSPCSVSGTLIVFAVVVLAVTTLADGVVMYTVYDSAMSEQAYPSDPLVQENETEAVGDARLMWKMVAVAGERE